MESKRCARGRGVNLADIRGLSYNDGFGTLSQAGWSPQAPIPGTHCAPGGVLAMARVGDELILAFQPEAGAAIYLRKGRYHVHPVCARGGFIHWP